MIVHNAMRPEDYATMLTDMATLNQSMAEIMQTLLVRCENLQRHAQELGSGMDDAWDNQPVDAARVAIAEAKSLNGMYYTPRTLIEPASGSGDFLLRACEIVGNPPYAPFGRPTTDDRRPTG